jgi:hypothetical protein
VFDRDEQEISQVIENGLEAILSGSATLDSVIAQHPEQADVIRPELEGALWLVSRREEVESRPGFVTASRKRVIERIKAEASSQGAKHSMFGFAWPQRVVNQWMVAVVFLVAILSGAGGLMKYSQSALPGDGLYAIKRVSEQMTYSTTIGEVHRVQLNAQFTEQRLTEVKDLVDKGEFITAGTALQDYEVSVQETLVLLEQASDAQPNDVEALAVTLKQNFASNAVQLSELVQRVPADTKVRDQMIRAADHSLNGALAANRVYMKIIEKKLNPGVPSPTILPPMPSPSPMQIGPSPTAPPRVIPTPTIPVPTKPPIRTSTVAPNGGTGPTKTPSKMPPPIRSGRQPRLLPPIRSGLRPRLPPPIRSGRQPRLPPLIHPGRQQCPLPPIRHGQQQRPLRRMRPRFFRQMCQQMGLLHPLFCLQRPLTQLRLPDVRCATFISLINPAAD